MVVVAAAAAFSPVLVGNAYAFKLFGITIFGKDEDENLQVPDPVRYDVDLEAGTADSDLKEALENSSRLVGDKNRPVSGDLGVVVKAREAQRILRHTADAAESRREAVYKTVLLQRTANKRA